MEYCETTIESRVAQLETKFSCIDSLNGENAKLRIENDVLSDENAKQKVEIHELEIHVTNLTDEVEQLAEQAIQAENKVKLLEAEVKALKDCDDNKDSPSQEPGETPKDEGATNDVARTDTLNKLTQRYQEISDIRGS